MPTADGIAHADTVQDVFRGIPYALPGLICIALFVILVHARPTWLRGVPRGVVIAWLASFAVTLTMTLTPTADAPELTPCTLEPSDLSGPLALSRLSERSLNVYLFVPLGLTSVLATRRRLVVALVVVGATLPFVIEIAQRRLPALGRGCQLSDVIDNLTGLAIGVALGLAYRTVVAFRRRRSGPRIDA